jgi:hypothetical protein
VHCSVRRSQASPARLDKGSVIVKTLHGLNGVHKILIFGFSGESHNLNKKFWAELIAYFPSYDTGQIENDASNNSSIVACVFVTVVKFLPSRCLATIREFTYRHID